MHCPFVSVSSFHRKPLSKALLCTFYRWASRDSGIGHTANQYMAGPGSTSLIRELLSWEGLPMGRVEELGGISDDIQEVVGLSTVTGKYESLSRAGGCLPEAGEP